MTMDSETSSLSSTSELEPAPSQSFRFFDLPAELRRKILDEVFIVDGIIDMDFNASRTVKSFLVSRQFYREATATFYGRNTFRLLPIRGKVMKRRAQPLMKRFAARHRASIVSLELRLGPFWSQPPRCWKVDRALGLEDATAIRVLRVFVECDPSHSLYDGFRRSKDFYTMYAGGLLKEVVARLPSLREVQFDGYPSVSLNAPLMQKLAHEALLGRKKVVWKPGQKGDEDEPASKKDARSHEHHPFHCSEAFLGALSGGFVGWTK